jgi:hypothetical protein
MGLEGIQGVRQRRQCQVHGYSRFSQQKDTLQTSSRLRVPTSDKKWRFTSALAMDPDSLNGQNIDANLTGDVRLSDIDEVDE